jgi:tetratricopeptide (TPR) repeat protein
MADVVYLKDGEVLKGKVIEKGDDLIIQKKLGSRRIPKKEVIRVELDSGETRQIQRSSDRVILKSGEELEGNARILGDGRKVVVEGKLGIIEIDTREVKYILWATGKEGDKGALASGKNIERVIEKLLGKVTGKDRKASEKARRDLIYLGTFAAPHIERLWKRAEGGQKRLLGGILRIVHLKALLDEEVETKIDNLYERLTSEDPAVRIGVLREISFVNPRVTPALLLHLLPREKDAVIRAYAIDRLSRMGRFEDLIELLRGPDGSLRVAAAIALGDNEILVGVPILIDALKIEDRKIRELAMKKLRDFTGQKFGFPQDGPAEKQKAAIAKWHGWWNEKGEELVRQSLKGIHRHRITQKEREAARKYWKIGNEIWDTLPPAKSDDDRRAREVDRAAAFFGKALETNPLFANARISLAVLLFSEKGDLVGAKKELELVVGRYAADCGTLARQIAYYYLGSLYRGEKKWREARRNYLRALELDGSFIDARVALGETFYEDALGEKDLDAKRKMELLRSSIDEFGAALKVIGWEEKSMTGVARTLASVGKDRPFKEGAIRRNLARAKQELKRKAAWIHFLKGRAFTAMQKHPAALREYGLAAQLNPEEPRYPKALKFWEGEAKAREEKKR